MDEKFVPLFDDRNRDLWEVLNQKYEIILDTNSEPGYLTEFQKDVIIVFIDTNNIDPAPFAHELLHIYLKYKGVLIAAELRNRIKENENLRKFFSASLQEQIGNALEHQKMIKLYRDRGFEDEKFVRDYHIKIMDNQQLQYLLTSYRISGSYKRDAVDMYIGKFFSMKASNNRGYDYSLYYQRFKSLDSILFEILDNFWSKWLDYDIDEPQENYRQMLNSLILHLDRWVGKRDFQ